MFKFIFGISNHNAVNGGAMRDRTADLLRARQALSQLSYSPINVFPVSIMLYKNFHYKVFFLRQGVGWRRLHQVNELNHNTA